MIPAKFEYHRPRSIDEAVALLGRFGDDGRVLAGGHSLIPMMKLRLAEPSHLVDINGISELKGIAEKSGVLTIGAATTQADLLASDVIREKCPILIETAEVVADPQVRYCGTLGGNVANGDPGNDYPAVMIALSATFTLRGPDGVRQVAADGFYRGIFDTALGEGELLAEINIPVPAAGHGYAYEKMKRKVGDYATAAAAVVLTMSGGTCESATIALTNLGSTPLKVSAGAAALVGKAIDEAAIEEAARDAVEVADPASDLRGPAAYRKQMAGEMTRRALKRALQRAQGA
ncbi:MAG: FAD binding domain-containing protein [Alphaproteobacteria bacterium]